MISIEILLNKLPGLGREDVERWVVNGWVRPDDHAGEHIFHDIDVARIQLIQELRDVMQINEEAMPVVLSLLDQLYSLRRHLRELSAVVTETLSDDVKKKLVETLRTTA